jgi:hypothetical protein
VTYSPEIGARIAWGYLASLVSLLVGGLVMAVCNQVFPVLLCPAASDVVANDASEDCAFAWVLLSFLVGTAGGLAVMVNVLKQDFWLWAGICGVAMAVCVNAQFTQWWWIALLVLTPAVGAAISAQWSAKGRPAWQQVLLAALPVAALGAFVLWVLFF